MLGVSGKIGLVCCLLFPTHAYGYENGAPKSACADMTPQHRPHIPQTSANPYQLTPDITEVKGGEKVTLTLSGDSEHKGFLIRIGKVGTDNYDGTWKEGGKVRTTDCDGKGKVATHSNPNGELDTDVVWTAPNEEGEYEILFTVVKDKTTFWVRQSAGKITVKGIGGDDDDMGGGSKNITIAPSLFTVAFVMTLLAILCFSSEKFL